MRRELSDPFRPPNRLPERKVKTFGDVDGLVPEKRISMASRGADYVTECETFNDGAGPGAPPAVLDWISEVGSEATCRP